MDWRSQRATDKQVQLLIRRGFIVNDELTRGDASDLISSGHAPRSMGRMESVRTGAMDECPDFRSHSERVSDLEDCGLDHADILAWRYGKFG